MEYNISAKNIWDIINGRKEMGTKHKHVLAFMQDAQEKLVAYIFEELNPDCGLEEVENSVIHFYENFPKIYWDDSDVRLAIYAFEHSPRFHASLHEIGITPHKVLATMLYSLVNDYGDDGLDTAFIESAFGSEKSGAVSYHLCSNEVFTDAKVLDDLKQDDFKPEAHFLLGEKDDLNYFREYLEVKLGKATTDSFISGIELWGNTMKKWDEILYPSKHLYREFFFVLCTLIAKSGENIDEIADEEVADYLSYLSIFAE